VFVIENRYRRGERAFKVVVHEWQESDSDSELEFCLSNIPNWESFHVVRTVFQMFLDTRSGTNGRAGICCGTFLSREVTQYLYDTRCSSSEPPYPLLVSQLVDPDALRTSDSSRVHTQILAHDMNACQCHSPAY